MSGMSFLTHGLMPPMQVNQNLESLPHSRISNYTSLPALSALILKHGARLSISTSFVLLFLLLMFSMLLHKQPRKCLERSKSLPRLALNGRLDDLVPLRVFSLGLEGLWLAALQLCLGAGSFPHIPQTFVVWCWVCFPWRVSKRHWIGALQQFRATGLYALCHVQRFRFHWFNQNSWRKHSQWECERNQRSDLIHHTLPPLVLLHSVRYVTSMSSVWHSNETLHPRLLLRHYQTPSILNLFGKYPNLHYLMANYGMPRAHKGWRFKLWSIKFPRSSPCESEGTLAGSILLEYHLQRV